MTGPQAIWHYGEIVTLSDVGPIDPAPEHTHVERVEGCWACEIHRARYGCLGCGDVVAEGHLCRRCAVGRVA